MAGFLVVRGDDHVVPGVRWAGMTVAGPVLRADTADARLVLTFAAVSSEGRNCGA